MASKMNENDSPFKKTCQVILLRSNGVWLGQTSSRSRSALVDCGRWNLNRFAVPTARCFANISSARMNGCNGAVWSFDVRAIYSHYTGNHRCTYKPTSHIDSSRSDDCK
ncbi:hypothetical protein AVEN_97984-1 [Araneus ventricosus]|uniref:Uncharacterized protein n=1 Tax=Araneus ventricosus TaxID=182803 RepID=A0A4Y2IWV7_ARAVE|nr:hypothetical protein AVEN_97984-1 [Araneus ventricosus]